ncbi:glutamate ligase domain-containing protein [Staphylococcus aureus]
MIAVWSKGTIQETIIKAVENLEPVEGRLEVLDLSLPIDLIIDYAHTADGMNKLIDAVQPFVKQKLIFLVGMAGERDLTNARNGASCLSCRLCHFHTRIIRQMMTRKC